MVMLGHIYTRSSSLRMAHAGGFLFRDIFSINHYYNLISKPSSMSKCFNILVYSSMHHASLTSTLPVCNMWTWVWERSSSADGIGSLAHRITVTRTRTSDAPSHCICQTILIYLCPLSALFYCFSIVCLSISLLCLISLFLFGLFCFCSIPCPVVTHRRYIFFVYFDVIALLLHLSFFNKHGMNSIRRPRFSPLLYRTVH